MSHIKAQWHRLSGSGEDFNTFDFTIAGAWDCMAAVKRLLILHCSVDFIFLSFGATDSIVEL